MIVVVQTVPVAGIRLVRLLPSRHRIFQRRAIYEEKVQPAVAIVVQHSHAAAHGFRQIFLRGQAGLILEMNARAGSDIGKRGELDLLAEGVAGQQGSKKKMAASPLLFYSSDPV